MTSHTNLYVLGAAVVGIVSAAGVFIVEHFIQERRRHSMAQDLARLDRQLSGLQKELEQLRCIQKQSVRLKKHANLQSRTSNISKFQSASEVDSSDLEFYDLSDDDTTISTVTPLEQVLKEIDDDLNVLEVAKIQYAYDRLSDLNIQYPQNQEILWHFGKACYKMISTVDDASLKQEFVTKGIEMCQAALDINPNIANAHKWCAILIGVRSNSQSIQGKISDGYLFKKHIDAALNLNLNDATLHHMLGRFTYESANLKWYERKVAATFFTEPPNGTFDEALEHFLSAEKIMDTDWKENKLLIAKCLIALGRYKEAIEALSSADAMVNNSLDNEIESEVKVLLQKYNSYR